MNQEGTHRKLAAILSADVKEYSRLMSQDERGTIRTLTAYKERMSSLIQEYKGRVVDAPGDNLLAEFGSVVNAVNCAVEIQRELAEQNANIPPARQMQFRIGINLGDIVEEEGRIYGDGVNIASRVESLAEGGGICISGIVYDQIENKLNFKHEYLGEQKVKNIAKPVRVYRVGMEPNANVPEVIREHEFPDKPSIAVLPFTNISGDPEQEYFSDGITEQIITGLSKIPQLFVIARHSTFAYKGQSVNAIQVGRELGVRNLLEGSVQKFGDRLRITTQLIDATAGHHLWAEHYDRDLKDVFALQDDITRNVMRAMRVELTGGEQGWMEREYETSNFDAYLKLLQAAYYMYRNTELDNARAKQLAEEAIVLDPEYAAAYMLLGYTQLQDMASGWTKDLDKSLELANEFVQKALSLNDSLTNAHTLLGSIYLFKGQNDIAIAELERAVELNPNGADCLFELGWGLRCVGRPEEGIPFIERAIRLNPTSPVIYFDVLGRAYFLMGRYQDAIEAYNKAVNINPDHLDTHTGLAAVYSILGRAEHARAEAAEILRINPKFSTKEYATRMKHQVDIELEIDGLRQAGLK
jgi:adenylate cyclase